MSLYHAYRPQTFAAIVGQEHVKRTLQNAVREGKVAHAYLFSGSRGIGKTSVARILAMAVNCAEHSSVARSEVARSQGPSKTVSRQSKVDSRKPDFEPCGACTSCTEIRKGVNLNVIEIDAASNRGIDEIRTLRESVGFSPSKSFDSAQDARKVHIIDEVHMLTKEAFNALLKTLEEPPAHALFILATTELHRVPDTIISRTQHFAFKRATIADITSHLERIAKEESLELEPEAVALLALHADGAFRDALSLLDQLASLGERPITAEHIRLLLGIAPEAELVALLTASFSGDAKTIHVKLAEFSERGYDPGALSDALMTLLRQVLWAHYGLSESSSELVAQFAAEQGKKQSPQVITGLIERLIIAKQQLRWSPLPLLPLELALLPQSEQIPTSKFQVPNKSKIQSSKSETVPVRHSERNEVESENLSDVPDPSIPSRHSVAQDDKKKTAETAPTTNSPKKLPSTGQLPTIWSAVIEAVRQQNAPLAALLRSSSLLNLAPGEATVQVPFSFYADRLKDRKNLPLVLDALKSITSFDCTLVCTVAGATEAIGNPPSPQGFGGAGRQQATGPTRSQADVEKDVLEVFGAASVEETSHA